MAAFPMRCEEEAATGGQTSPRRCWEDTTSSSLFAPTSANRKATSSATTAWWAQRYMRYCWDSDYGKKYYLWLWIGNNHGHRHYVCLMSANTSCPLGLKDDYILVLKGPCDLTKYIFGHNSRFHIMNIKAAVGRKPKNGQLFLLSLLSQRKFQIHFIFSK